MRDELMSSGEWTITRLGEAFYIHLGKMLSPEAAIGIGRKPYLANRNVQWNRLDLRNVNYMSFTSDERARYRLRRGDVLICEGGEIGRTAIWNDEMEECYFQKAIHRLRPKRPRIDSRFLLHYMRYAVDHDLLIDLVGQTSIAHLPLEKLSLMPVVHPLSISEQRRIAEVIDTIDDKICQTERVIAKLGLGQEGIQSHLLEQIQEPVWPLMDCLASRPRNGFSPKEVDGWTGLMALGLGCLTESGFEPRQLKNVPPRGVSNHPALLEDGDLLISRANTRELVGLVGRYRDIGVPCIYPDLMMRLRPNARCRADFLEIMLRSSSVRRQIQAVAQGTSESMVKISASSVCLLRVAIPDLSVQDRIIRIVDQGNAHIRSERRQLEKLLLLKRGLMEDLLSGRVRLSA